jgi:hypothetical protein
MPPDHIRYQTVPIGRRVNAIGQHEFRIGAYAFQQKRDEQRPGAIRQPWKDGTELFDVVRPQIGWQLHTRHHQHDLRLSLSHPLQDQQQVFLRLLQR